MRKYVFLVALFGLTLGLIPQTEAGIIVPLTPGGGGGSGVNPSVYFGSGYNNHLGPDSFWDAQAYGNAGGPIVTQSPNASFSFTPNTDPKPGNAGQFNLNISASGAFFPPDGTVTPEMQELVNHPLSNSGSFNISDVTVVQNGQWLEYHFDPAVLFSWNGTGSVYPGYEGGPYNGSLYVNASVKGGHFTGSSPYFEINHWDGGGPRPDWLSDWNAGFNFSGVATPSSVTVVPEPATLALLAFGGTTFWGLRRRGKNRVPNRIA